MFRVIKAATILLSNFVCFICSADIQNGIGDYSATMIIPPMKYIKMEDLSSKTALAEIVDEMAKPQMEVSQSVHVRASAYSMPGVRYPSLRPIVPTGLSPAMNGFSAYVGPMTQPIPQTPVSFGLPAAKNTMSMPSVHIGFGNQVPDVSRAFSFDNRNSGHTMHVLSSLEVICSQAGAVIRQVQSAGLESFLKYSPNLQDITQCLARSCSLLHDVRNQLMSQIKGQVTSAFGGTLVHRAGGENRLGTRRTAQTDHLIPAIRVPKKRARDKMHHHFLRSCYVH